VVAVSFQSIFYSKIYQNNIFLKKLFLTSAHQNDLKTQKNINLNQRKKIQFFSKALLKRKKMMCRVFSRCFNICVYNDV
jgi:hypothetical protein